MQSRILQVTRLGNFQPWLPRHLVDGRPQGRQKTRGVRIVPVNCTIARLRGSSRPDDDDSALVAESFGEYMIPFRSRVDAASHPMWANDFLCIRSPCFQRGYLVLARFGLFPLNY
jgi:hypothetical protein